MTLHEELEAAGVPLDNHESDLYAKVCDASTRIVQRVDHPCSVFVSQIDGTHWYDLPFAFDPFWLATY